MRITVTLEDIANGKFGPSTCPIAQALRRMKPGYRVVVGRGRIQLGSESWVTPPEAERFILAFDAGKTPEPMEFELR